jgi:large subunit ribosomal protein L5
MIPRLKEQYNKKIVIDLQKKFSMKNKYMVPKFAKVVLNMGLGLNANDKKIVQNCVEDMSLISGQKPIITKFKKSISNFKTRKGTSNTCLIHWRNVTWGCHQF